MQTRRWCLRAGAAAPFISSASRAADWPERPVTLIVPWAPGGGTDAVGRAFARVLSAQLGVPVPVMNRPGGSGTVGHLQIRDAAPDGYTIGFIAPQLVSSPLLGPAPLTWRDVQPIALINTDPSALTVGIQKPWRTLADFVAEARRNPRSLRLGNSGPGGTWHIAALELERKAGIELIHVPYAGAAPGLQDVVGGHIEGATFSAAEARTQVTNGQARMLAVFANERLRSFPDVPTAAEQGLAIEVSTWRGLATSKGTPAPVLAKLESAAKQAVENEFFQNFMYQQGFGATFLDAAGLAAFLGEQDTKYRALFGG